MFALQKVVIFFKTCRNVRFLGRRSLKEFSKKLRKKTKTGTLNSERNQFDKTHCRKRWAIYMFAFDLIR